MAYKGHLILMAALIGFSALPACKKTTTPMPRPVVTRPPELTPVGIWQSADRSTRQLQMILRPNGELQFQGGMSFLNPGYWDFDPVRNTLVLSFPQAPDEKLQVFKLYIGQGVESLDRPGKRVIYRYTETTDSLNVAGWTFTKLDLSKPDIAPEPTLR
jgi:hypothetical protein